MNFVPPDSCLQDYKKRRSALLQHLIASTSNVSLRAKEFRRWIDENSPKRDNDEAYDSDARTTGVVPLDNCQGHLLRPLRCQRISAACASPLAWTDAEYRPSSAQAATTPLASKQVR